MPIDLKTLWYELVIFGVDLLNVALDNWRIVLLIVFVYMWLYIFWRINGW